MALLAPKAIFLLSGMMERPAAGSQMDASDRHLVTGTLTNCVIAGFADVRFNKKRQLSTALAQTRFSSLFALHFMGSRRG